jgi:SAM-dependent methyltransferase
MRPQSYITAGDLEDLLYKARLKGGAWLRNKFRFSRKQRVLGTWDMAGMPPVNWWVVPGVRRRWNRIISGSPGMAYPEYLEQNYLAGRNDLRMLSPACGTGSHEIPFAAISAISGIEGFDISPVCIAEASEKAGGLSENKLRFFVADAQETDFGTESYDLLLFHSSLHHFRDLENLITKFRQALKPGGLLILHDYTGPSRFQWTEAQLATSTEVLRQIPESFRKRYGTGKVKKSVHRPGLLRMRLSDPSEAAESSLILPLLNRHFVRIEEKKLGGDLVHLILKDIAHHFLDEQNTETADLLSMLFETEDRFLEGKAQSDFTFGIYRKD